MEISWYNKIINKTNSDRYPKEKEVQSTENITYNPF